MGLEGGLLQAFWDGRPPAGKCFVRTWKGTEVRGRFLPADPAYGDTSLAQLP